jgi:predicted porin
MLVGGTKAKTGGLIVAFAMAAVIVGGSAASAADMDAMVTKAPIYYAPPAPAACGSAYDFFFTACPLSWYGVTFYGTVDLGGTYQTHGTPFDRNFPSGASYLIGAGGAGATGRTAGFGLGPNAMSQSNVGVKINEPIAPGGWSFIAQGELAFDPYSGLLANAPQAMQNGIGVPQNQQAIPADSSRWGWLNTNDYVGFSQPVYGTLTFGRQNALMTDGVNAYDPMGGAYAFSPIGFSGKAAGAGDTEDARWTTAIKYRVNIGDFRFGVMGQPLSSGYDAYNPNNGAVAGDIGGDIKHFGPGTLSLDVIGTWEKDAVNITDSYGCAAGPACAALGPAAATPAGPPTSFPGAYLKATISNQTVVMALAKYSFGSWGNTPPPVVGKAAPAPSGPSGIPLTLYAGYEWIQFANPSDRQSSFRDDGFLFADPTALGVAHGQTASANFTAINNNAFNANCGTGTGGCSDEIFQIMWVGAKYGITKDLDIVGGYYHYIQNQYTAQLTGAALTCAVAAAHSQCAGTFDVFSMVLDWRFLPKWDAYIGTMYSSAAGGIANGDIATNNLATTAGVRFRF